MTDDTDELLALRALGALPADERSIADAALDDPQAPGHDELAARTAVYDRTVALLGEGDALAPPAALRGAVLAAARQTPQAPSLQPDAASPIDVYLRQAGAFRDAARQVERSQWHLAAAPYDWNLHGLVAHLLQIERYFERVLGLVEGSPDPHELDHLRFGAAGIDAELRREPGDTLDDWWATVERVGPHLGSIDLDRGVQFHQWPFTVRSLLIARSFELWTHADDVRRATGRTTVAPAPEDVRAMSSASVGSLPLAIHVVADEVPSGRARVVLTGRGGATFDVELGGGGDELTTVVVDVVDWCRVAARRIDVASMARAVDGDRGLADQLFAAAAIIAM